MRSVNSPATVVIGNASPVLVYNIAVHVKGVAKERAQH